MSQKNYKPHYEHLKNKWKDRHKEIQKQILEKHGEAFYWLTHHLRNMSVGAIGVLLLATNHPGIAIAQTNAQATQSAQSKELNKDVFLVFDLSTLIPSDVRPLSREEEQHVGQILSDRFGFHVTAELEGKH